MPLHLVGETIEKSRAHYQAETGRLLQLMRGIYVDVDDDIDTTVLQHAVRIARYLYPRAYLAAASSVLLRPTDTGKLYISGPRIQRTRLRTLEIVQNRQPASPSLAKAIIDDGMGEFTVDVSSIRQRVLEAFRIRSEHASSMDDAMRMSIAERLIEEYGSREKAADALWALARENEWYKEGEAAERFLRKGVEVKPTSNLAALDFIVAWHGVPIGRLVHDGFEWRWHPAPEFKLPLVRQTVPGKLPPFISSLLPEGWLESVLKLPDDRAALRSGRRYMSNIIVTEQPDDLRTLPADILQAPLERFMREGVFTGTYRGPARDEFERSFEENLAQLYARSETPRLSGVQIKAPMCLEATGSLEPATARPFTHILKPAGTSGFEALPLVEWMSLSLGREAGFEVPAFALVRMPDNLMPSLIVERFDIRTSPDDTRQLALEDFCSMLDLTAADKYRGTIEQAGRALRGLSTSPDEDLLILLRRGVFAWLIADGDMHLKNLAVLKTAYPGERVFSSVRMAPLYDAVTTVVFPGLQHDRMAMKLNGKDDRLRRADFVRAATTMGLRASDAEQAISTVVDRLSRALEHVVLPGGLSVGDEAEATIGRMLEASRQRVSGLVG
jgi:serine/threonine-protein kinase HipA